MAVGSSFLVQLSQDAVYHYSVLRDFGRSPLFYGRWPWFHDEALRLVRRRWNLVPREGEPLPHHHPPVGPYLYYGPGRVVDLVELLSSPERFVDVINNSPVGITTTCDWFSNFTHIPGDRTISPAARSHPQLEDVGDGKYDKNPWIRRVTLGT